MLVLLMLGCFGWILWRVLRQQSDIEEAIQRQEALLADASRPISSAASGIDDVWQGNDDSESFGFNPANGLPMLNSCVDVMGNPYGWDDWDDRNSDDEMGRWDRFG